MRAADYIAKFLKKKGVNEIFMLTGYGAMYLNDAIQSAKIKHYASRNEAAAPMMASSYSKISGKIGAVCVTAGPGATNALPGLAEAWVDSSPVMIFSGQVEKKHTTNYLNIKGLRTYGTAEINIIESVKHLTKFSAVVKKPNQIRYLLEKAFYYATNGRPGPVWLDIPLDVQKARIEPKRLRGFFPKKNYKFANFKDIQKTIKLISNSKKLAIICGQGVRQSKSIKITKKLINKLKAPVIFSRLGQDIISHDADYIFGTAGIKGSKFAKKITRNADLILVFGSRLSIPFIGYKSELFSKKTKILMIDIDKAELKKPLNVDFKINCDLRDFLIKLESKLNKKQIPDFNNWLQYCKNLKKNNPIIERKMKKNPMDLYFFMDKLGKFSKKESILITDAGSNYYVGGQVWKFEKGQREITSGSNAAMGLTIPLAIGASVAEPKKNIYAVTGDGSLELNIQELKTISHYNLNIKLFVINNGGYVSMLNWQDTIFKGRRIDTKKAAGHGTLNLKNIAKAFDLNWLKISRYQDIELNMKKINQVKGPLFVEVITTNKQKIIDSYGYLT
jgi:acetolactate synthase-1/2/3 large subunit